MRTYTTIDNVLNYALLEADASFNPVIESWIESVTKFIETETNRVFIADETASERKYDGDRQRTLKVDDFIEITKLTIDDREIENFLTYPANTEHKNTIYHENGFDCGKQNVKVEAKWGYSEDVPKDIELVATVLVAGIIQGQNKTSGAKIREKIGHYEVQFSDNQKMDFEKAKVSLGAYKKIAI